MPETTHKILVSLYPISMIIPVSSWRGIRERGWEGIKLIDVTYKTFKYKSIKHWLNSYIVLWTCDFFNCLFKISWGKRIF